MCNHCDSTESANSNAQSRGSRSGARLTARQCVWLLAWLLGCSSTGALAQTEPARTFHHDLREYGWIEFGGAVIGDLDGRLQTPAFATSPDTDVRLSLSPGFAVSGGFGERFAPSFIAELQAGLFYHNIDEIRATPAGRWSIDASLFQIPIMVNLVFEVPLRHQLKPFVGAGVGTVISWLDIDDNLPIPGEAPGPRLDRTSTEISFAYQGFAGLRLQLARQGVLAVTYRAVAGGSPRWTLKDRESGQSIGSLKVDDILVHSVAIGFMVPF
jgi:opacity protein-like surface antigen